MTKEIHYCDRCNKKFEYPVSTSYLIFYKKENDNLEFCQKCYDKLDKWINKKKEEQ